METRGTERQAGQQGRGRGPATRAPPPPRKGKKAPPRALDLFVEVGGAYRLRPGILNSYRACRAGPAEEGVAAAVPSAAYLSGIRRGLDPRRLRDCGYDGGAAEIDDATLAVAVTGGIVTNPAFLAIVDDLLVRASCLCCYYTRQRSKAADAEGQILLLLDYYAQGSYESSTAFYRVLSSLLRDISAAEADMVCLHTRQGPRDPLEEEPAPAVAAARAGARALSRVPGVCAISVGHPPARPSTIFASGGWVEVGLLAGGGAALCVYSTPEGRKLLRILGKACKVRGLTLTTRIATSINYEYFCLRHKLRLYALECHAPGTPGADGETPIDVFWQCVGAVARRRL